ncbi:MAG: hypothetical protein ACI9SJ_001715 [Flavobacteriaceae bacterium]|jgi:hypothetical protein
MYNKLLRYKSYTNTLSSITKIPLIEEHQEQIKYAENQLYIHL